MPIEFRCQRCQRLLRTADDTGGKQTKCPECGTILDIPLPAAAVPEPPPVVAVPVAAPLAASPFTAAGPQGAAALDIGDIFNRTWNIYTRNLAQLIVAGLILLGVTLALLVPFFIVLGIALAIAAALADQGSEAIGALIVALLVSAGMLGTAVACAWLHAGFFAWLLKVARGQPNTFGDIFSGGPYMLPLLGAGLLSGLATMLGYLLCIVPGVILALVFSQFAWLIVDRGAGAIESLSRSKQLTDGNKLYLFLLMLLVVVINGVAGLVPFAFVFTMPFIWLLMAVTYLRLSGESPDAPR
jgi:phage FluMu protein Com